jgi:GNAT superfamily N-acetyltransferase
VRERALALVSVAHPDFRAELLAAARERRFIPLDQVPWPEGGRPYPVELESREDFRGAKVFFRPLRPTDERLLREFFYSHSADTVYQRYHMPLKSLSPRQIQGLCTLDYDARLALAGFAEEGGGERMVAVGRYELDRATNLAEVAFVVHDELQSRGIGTWLFRKLEAVARERGIAGFTAYVLADNVRMLGVFHRSGLPVVSSREGNILTLTMRFPGERETTRRPEPTSP